MSYSHIFMLMDYDIVKGLILEGINLQLTFIWTYNDLFIMFLSTALAYRFRQITTKIQSVSDAKVGNEITWKKLREDYDKLCRFCKALDEQISYIVLLAFASDLFFILVQLCSSLKRMRNNWERFYFYWSFGLLILRTVCLCLIGAKVNDESIKPLPILNSVPSDIYNIEIQRLIQQIASTPVAITGKNIFSITKGLILSIAGAIVTYELVLVQFNGNALNGAPESTGRCPDYVYHSPTTMKIEPLDKTSKMEKPMTPVNRESATLPKVKTSLENHNSHKSFSKMLILAQVFGFLPAQGILGPDFRSLHFTWKSARVGYTVLTILGATFISGMQLYKIFAKGLDLMEANRFFFNFSGVIAGCLFLNLARNWPVLMKDWGTVELSITALACRFSQITARIQSVADAKIDTEIIWKNLREDYNRLCRLCRRVDEVISYIVLLTFASDLFFILVQLFNSLKQMRNDLERLYFYWSFGLLILRTVCLCLFGAKVNDESTKPILILNSVPSNVYNLEIQRFIQQIGTSEVAITGKNFFSITRGLILSIAGAIVTYELVLIQFNDSLLTSTPEDTGSCPVYV
ncbi:gustatory receptor 5a for trehalose-like [Tenebrio molitor]|uniref:gustatory receptor 5a for trehalose-like n=1 Tax=Tenebrio molitor TaxID=7067 RepID=UPI003624A8E7